MASSRIFLVTGFAPFRGERINPSWEIALRLDGDEIGGLKVKSVKVPVGCAVAVRRINAAIVRYRPRAILGLGQAGGRPAISIEKVAINLADEKAGADGSFGASAKPVIAGAPEACFARLPIPAADARTSPARNSRARLAQRRRIRVQRPDVRKPASDSQASEHAGRIYPSAIRHAPERAPSRSAKHGVRRDGNRHPRNLRNNRPRRLRVTADFTDLHRFPDRNILSVESA